MVSNNNKAHFIDPKIEYTSVNKQLSIFHKISYVINRNNFNSKLVETICSSFVADKHPIEGRLYFF